MSLVNICNALAYALMKPWIPVPAKDPTPPATPGAESPAAKKGKPDPKAAKSKVPSVSITNEAMPDLKKAIEVNMSARLTTVLAHITQETLLG